MADDIHTDIGALRRRAEQRLALQPALAGPPRQPADMARLLHELQVHEIELQMQNDTLRESQAQVEAAAARYADFYDFSPAGFISLQAGSEILETNLTAARLLGRPRAMLTGMRFSGFVAPADRESLGRVMVQVFAGERPAPCRLELAVKGQPQRTVEFEAALAPDRHECRAVLVDITELKGAEEAKEVLLFQLQALQKMESIGRLAGGIAHDFNNMLAAIIGYTGLAMERAAGDLQLMDDLQEVLKAAERSAALTRQILAFASRQAASPRALDLNETLQGMLNMLRRLLGEDLQLEWLPGADLWPVKMDPSQVDQLLANLCVNSREALPGNGKVTIETSNTIFDEAHRAEHAGHAPGEFVRLTVSDNGPGMNAETQTHIFEPFFTTRAAGKGTGLGLATVWGIVHQNNGVIEVESRPGAGTAFNIYLPRHHGELAPAPVASALTPPRGNGETILLVEDEPAVLALGQRLLEGLGYRVLAVGIPGEALRLAREHPGEIHLLVTDVVMPGMNGRELAQRTQSLRPGLRRLFVSGYTADIIARGGVIEEDVIFIQKPFSLQDLAVKVREALEADA